MERVFNDTSEIHIIANSLIHKENGGIPYCYFSNADGKEWIINAESVCSLRMGLNIYEPQSPKGKMLKAMLPYMHGFIDKGDMFSFRAVKATIERDFAVCVSEAFQCSQSHLKYNFFLGTPSVHQKIIIQVDNGDNILGYVKVSSNPEVIESFRKEYEYLKWLKKCNINNVPSALYCSSEEKIGIFIQSSQRMKGSYSDYHIRGGMLEFLKKLEYNTRESMLFEESDYFSLIKDIDRYLMFYPGNKQLFKEIINTVYSKYVGQEIFFSAYHGDFTPWNSYYNKDGRFYCFDFEYALKAYFPYLDLYHWFVSDCIFRKHMQYEQIRKAFDRSEIKKIDDYADRNVALYLIGEIAFYLKRERGDLTGKNLENMLLWEKILFGFRNAL